MIKNNKLINNLVQHFYKLVDNFLSDFTIYILYKKYKGY